MPKKISKLHIAILDSNQHHITCISNVIHQTIPNAHIHVVESMNDLIALKKQHKKLGLLIFDPHKNESNIKDISQFINPSRVLILSSHPSTESEHAFLELGYDHYLPKTRNVLDKLPIHLKKILSKKNPELPKGNHFDSIKQNLKILSQVINSPRLGIKMGHKQWNYVESEMEGIIKKIKNLV